MQLGSLFAVGALATRAVRVAGTAYHDAPADRPRTPQQRLALHRQPRYPHDALAIDVVGPPGDTSSVLNRPQHIGPYPRQRLPWGTRSTSCTRRTSSCPGTGSLRGEARAARLAKRRERQSRAKRLADNSRTARMCSPGILWLR